MERRTLGQWGEDLACHALRRRGDRIVERNWRCHRGEIDIVAHGTDGWVFVEVKTRHSEQAGLADQALTPQKLNRVTELAQIYLGTHDLADVNWRIDLVAIELDRRGVLRRMNIVPCLTLE